MKVLVILGQKGGCGKTTLAENLSVAADAAGLTVAVLDLDSQETLHKWSQRRATDRPAVVHLPVEPLAPVLAQARKQKVDLVVIDTSPRTAERSAEAVRVADLVLLPVKAGIHDVETIPALLQMLTVAGSPPAFVVLNELPSSGPYRAEAELSVRDFGLDVCPVAIGQRRAIFNAPKSGLSVLELEPHGKAAEEYRDLWRFIVKPLNLSTSKPKR